MRLRARLSLIAAALFLLLIVLAKPLIHLFAPFLVAFVMVAIIDPFVTKMENAGIVRGIGAFLGIAVIGFSLIGLVWMMVVNLVREAHHFKVHVPEYAARAEDLVATGMAYMNTLTAIIPHPFDEVFLNGTGQMVELLETLTGQLVAKVGAVPNFLIMGLVALTLTYFLSRDKRLIGGFLFGLMPKRWHHEVRQLKDEISNGLLGFVRAQAILIVLSMTLSVLGLWIFRIPYAWILGTFAGVLDIVPMVGPSGVFVPVIIGLMATSQWTRALGLVSVWLMILLLRQFVEPQVVGRHVGIHPVTSIASIYLGGSLLGMNGVLIGPLVAITVKAVCVVSIFPYLNRE